MIQMSIQTEIQAELQKLTHDFDVSVLYACESGSRAWGFPSKDSDYDVRFVYTHRPEWYLSMNLEHKRDVIELPINDVLDINGWDLRKALKLYRKSNPPLLEWLGSPIVYNEQGQLADKLRALATQYYSPISCMYHYFHMAKGNYREYL
ncbi:MAG: nucleotidyltransferase domain-containing protein, partial [Chloroflexota bacterium]